LKISNKFAIGCLVQWYEIEIVEEYIKSLKQAISNIENKENVIVDLCFNLSQKLEKIDKNKIDKKGLLAKFSNDVKRLEKLGVTIDWRVHDSNEFYYHADYRRDLNYNYCKKVDYVMWGETDSFFPKEAFHVIETLSEYTTKENIHKYLLSFSDRKMWDSSWDPLVHKDYEHLEFIDDDEGHLNPNQAKSQLSIEKMNEINAKAKEFEFTYINKPKISGACLVLSADLIKSGVNIPSCLIYNDDEGLSIMCEKLLGNQFIQFICKNVLHVHARRHPQKRCYVANENNPNAFINQKVDTFQKFLQLSKANVQRLITGKDKFYEYDDFEKELQ